MTAWGAGWVEAASRYSSWRGPHVETLPCLPEHSPQWVSEPGVKAQNLFNIAKETSGICSGAHQMLCWRWPCKRVVTLGNLPPALEPAVNP